MFIDIAYHHSSKLQRSDMSYVKVTYRPYRA